MKFIISIVAIVLALCVGCNTVAAQNAPKLDGSQVTALYHQVHTALFNGDWTTFESLFDTNAEIYLQGFGLGSAIECSPVSVKFAYDGINKFYNTSRAMDSQILAAYNTIHVQTIFAGLLQGLDQPPVVTNVLKAMRCNANCTKVVYWHDIADLVQTKPEQLTAAKILADGWTTNNVHAYLSAFSQEIKYSFWYQGASIPATVFNYTMFEGYGKTVFPLAGVSAMVPILQISGGCHHVAVRSLVIQSKLDGQGPAAIQDNIVFFEVEKTVPYRLVKASQLIQNP